MSDIVERLRQIAGPGVVQSTVDEAANEIETLRANAVAGSAEMTAYIGTLSAARAEIETLRAANYAQTEVSRSLQAEIETLRAKQLSSRERALVHDALRRYAIWAEEVAQHNAAGGSSDQIMFGNAAFARATMVRFT